MRLLLDTHTFIWFLNGDLQLDDTLKKQIRDSQNDCFLSIASLWEIAIKSSIGKLKLKGPFEDLAYFLNISNIEVLPINFAHTCTLLKLPFHHKDPFDRIIIAQALTENLVLATRDKMFEEYSVSTLWQDQLRSHNLEKTEKQFFDELAVYISGQKILPFIKTKLQYEQIYKR